MGSRGYSLHPYFKKMPDIGKELTRVNKKNEEEIPLLEEKFCQLFSKLIKEIKELQG